MSLPPRFVELLVTVQKTYLIPMDSRLGDKTQLDGRDIDELAQEWFVDFPLDHSHATRDAYALMGGKVLKIERGRDLPT